VCTRVDAAFLASSQATGNDLSTPVQEFGFPGLKTGDCWCLCASRWREALKPAMPQGQTDRNSRGHLGDRAMEAAETLRNRPELKLSSAGSSIICADAID
jgi:uncharacterized protein (DUF2237 family)